VRVVNPGFPDYVAEIDGKAGKTVTIGHDFSTANK
jgi:hypothetical protein